VQGDCQSSLPQHEHLLPTETWTRPWMMREPTLGGKWTLMELWIRALIRQNIDGTLMLVQVSMRQAMVERPLLLVLGLGVLVRIQLTMVERSLLLVLGLGVLVDSMVEK
jgi:hypothetical protein